jgi:hypothetical protein
MGDIAYMLVPWHLDVMVMILPWNKCTVDAARIVCQAALDSVHMAQVVLASESL